MSKILSKVVELASQLIQTAVESVEEHRQKKKVQKGQEELRHRLEALYMFQLNYQGNYDEFADAVFKCVQSNYQKLGLCRPNEVEDVCCDTDWQKGVVVPHIDGNYQNVIFRYEADRRISDMYLGGGKKLDCPKVSTENIAQGLYRELFKYTKRRGYGFADIDVIDIPGNRIRVTIYGVYRIHTWEGDLLD